MSVQFSISSELEKRYDEYALGYTINIKVRRFRNLKERLDGMRTLDIILAKLGEP